MKRYTFLFALAGLALFSSCNRDKLTEISEEEAVESVESFLAGDAGGYAKMVEDLVAIYEATNNDCNLSSDTTINKTVTQGVTTYNSEATYTFTLNCDGNSPNNLSISSTASRDFDAPRLSATANTTTSNNSLSNLMTGTAFLYNGVYALTGDVSSKIREQAVFNYSFTLTSTDITIDKSTLEITAGTATISFTGGGSSRIDPFNYSGTITFNGNGTATLVISGTSYNITIE